MDMDKATWEQLATAKGGSASWLPMSRLKLNGFDPSLSQGSCMALVLLFFSRHPQKNLGALLGGHFQQLYEKPGEASELAHCCINVMTQQRSLTNDAKGVAYLDGERFERWWRWLQYKGVEFSLQLLEIRPSTEVKSAKVFVGSVVEWVKGDGCYVVGANSAAGGHAVGFAVDGAKVVFYEPSYGRAEVPLDQFNDYLAAVVMKADGYRDWDRWIGAKFAQGASRSPLAEALKARTAV